jgi:hypothetical protein
MSAEADALCGAGCQERSLERVNSAAAAARGSGTPLPRLATPRRRQPCTPGSRRRSSPPTTPASSGFSAANDRTTWCWRAAPAAELVRAARVVADRLNPGWWRIEAYVQQSEHLGREGVEGVIGRQAQGSLPVQVRSGETPGSPVVGLPALTEQVSVEVEHPAPSGGAQLAGPQHEAKPAASSAPPAARRGKEEPSPCLRGRRPWTAPRIDPGAGAHEPPGVRGVERVRRVSWELERAVSAPGCGPG